MRYPFCYQEFQDTPTCVGRNIELDGKIALVEVSLLNSRVLKFCLLIYCLNRDNLETYSLNQPIG